MFFQIQSNRDEVLSRYSTTCMRGILALVVLAHHLFQFSGVDLGFALNHTLQAAGYLAVGMFYFLSGYGLTRSSRRKGYLQCFFKRRFIPLYAFYAFLVVIYAALERALSIDWTVLDLLQSLIFGNSLVYLGWYLQTLFLLYILFWVIFSTIPNDKHRLLTLTVSLAVYSLLCHACGLASTWYESVFCFPFGMLWAIGQTSIDSALLTPRLTNSKKMGMLVCMSVDNVCHDSGRICKPYFKNALCCLLYNLCCRYKVRHWRYEDLLQPGHTLAWYLLS